MSDPLSKLSRQFPNYFGSTYTKAFQQDLLVTRHEFNGLMRRLLSSTSHLKVCLVSEHDNNKKIIILVLLPHIDVYNMVIKNSRST